MSLPDLLELGRPLTIFLLLQYRLTLAGSYNKAFLYRTLMEETVNVESGYSEDELEKLREAHEDVREEAFLEDVFGHQSRISNQDFLNAVVKKATYMFSAQQLRKKVFEHAKVTMKSNLIAWLGEQTVWENIGQGNSKLV